MKTWTRKDRRVSADTAERLVHEPSGGRVKQWLAGVFLAAVPIVYGIVCIQRGHTTLFGRPRRGGNIDLIGEAGFWLAVAYIAIPSFSLFLGSQRTPGVVQQVPQSARAPRLCPEFILRAFLHDRLLSRVFSHRRDA
jgi:hypothetical protein